MIKRLIAALILVPTLVWGDFVKFDLGGTMTKEAVTLKNALTIQPMFGKNKEHIPFFDWKHERTETDNAVVNYSYGFGYIYAPNRRHSVKSQNTFQSTREEWDFKVTHENAFIKEGKPKVTIIKGDSSKVDSVKTTQFYKLGIEEGGSYSMLPDDNSFMAQIGFNLLLAKQTLDYKEKKSNVENPLRIILALKSNFQNRPVEVMAKVRFEYRNFFMEPVYEQWFNEDFGSDNNYELVFGYTGGF